MALLERILAMGITGSGKTWQWLQIARAIKPTGAKFRVVDTDNDVDFMLNTQFQDLLPENGGNVYVHPAFDWPEYKQSVRWITNKLTPQQLSNMDDRLVKAYKTPIKSTDWVIVDKINNAWSTVQRYFVDEVFGDDMGEYFLQIRKELHKHGDIGKSGKAAVSTVLEGMDGWKDWCVDEETEILTQRGWKRYNELVIGEKVLVLVQDTGKSDWEQLEDVYVGPNKTRKMMLMDGASHSSLSTLDHRWLTELKNKADKEYHYEWRTSETLKPNHRIPMCATNTSLPHIRTYTDDFVEMIAWYITEGNRTDRKYPQGTISQSIKHKEYVDRIDNVLRNEIGEVTRKIRDWGVIEWILPYHAMKTIDEAAPNKCPTYEFILKLTQSQLELFTETCLHGDGNIRDTGQKSFSQNEKNVIDVLEFAYILQGKAIRTHERINNDRFGKPEYYETQILQKNGVWPINAAQQVKSHRKYGNKQGKATCEVIDHNGIVWCPVTPSGTWLAKRNGTIYFTGNTVVNKLYDDWILPIIYRVHCHVYSATDVDELDRKEKDPEILSLFGDYRIKPAGQKKLGGQFHTVFLLIPGKNRWLMTTIKDRSGRKYFDKVVMHDLFMQYLVAKAGWKI